MAELILALDQGTTSSRAILFDRAGRALSVAQRELTQHYPKPGWVEHDPDEIWSSQAGVAAEALAKARARPADVAAIGITNQRETTVLWDLDTGRAVHNAIVWQDRRTAGALEALTGTAVERAVEERTGLVLDAYFSASKVKWLLDEVPEARELARSGRLAFGTVDSWLLYRLTGGEVHATDVTNAGRTMLFDIDRLAWDEELLEAFGVPPSVLPAVKPSSAVFGETSGDLLGARVPIAGLAGDQHAATFGQACFTPGMAKNTYGTGCFLVMNTGAERVASRNRLLSTLAWQVGDAPEYALEGSIFMAGAVVQWLRDGLGVIRSSDEVEQLARSVADSGGVFLVPAFAGLGAPYWDPRARGTIVGLTRGSSAAHLARAALESIAYQVADVIAAMAADSGAPLTELRVDGGAARNDLLLQFQADLLGVPVVRPRVSETTALGAAYLAGLEVGFWRDRAELAELWEEEACFEPRLPAGEREERLAEWRRALDRARDWAAD